MMTYNIRLDLASDGENASAAPAKRGKRADAPSSPIMPPTLSACRKC